MNLEAYSRQVIALASPRTLDLEYLLPAIIGDVGNLIGTVADRWAQRQAFDEEIISAYQDLACDTAVLLHRDRITDVSDVTSLRYVEDFDAALELILARATSVYRSGADTRGARAAGLWVCLADHCETITGKSFAEVLNA